LLDRVHADILRRGAQRLVERADKLGGEDAQPMYEQGGAAYLDTYRRYCEAPGREKRAPRLTASSCEEIAYDAARAFAAGHRTTKAVAVYRMMVAEDERTHAHSPLAAKAMFHLGTSYQSMALYEEAADWYERFAALPSRDRDAAATALEGAVILRLGLADEAAARRDVDAVSKSWGNTRPLDVANLTLALALHDAEHGAKERARNTLRGAMEMLDRAPIDIQVRAHALAATLADSPAKARSEHLLVLASWADPEAGERKLRLAWPTESEGQVDRRLARLLHAVGAARIFVADERRRNEVDTSKLPVYAGAIEPVALSTYAQTTLRDWYVKKHGAIASVEAEYIKVLEIRPVPPPASVIAAAAAVGAMWGDFADELRRAPAPAARAKDRALYKAYSDAVDGMREMLLSSSAKPAMKKCLDLSIKYQYADASSRTCAAWLTAHYEREFPPLDELIPAFRDPPGPASALRRSESPLRQPSPQPDR
jgi:tetratricopeptide (TPR) repeat protein